MNEHLQTKHTQALAEGVSIWDSGATMTTAVRMAEYLANAKIIPQQYQKNPGDCLVAIDLGRRMGLSPVTVMQNSQMVRGNFSWKGSFCKALVNMCGRFSNTRYEYCGQPGRMDWGCRMVAESAATHKTIHGPWVTMQMAKDEGWLSKDGSKWKTMPELMMRYRAAAFFARTECPEVLSGFYTAEEVIDIPTAQDAPEEKEDLKYPDVRYESPVPEVELHETRIKSERATQDPPARPETHPQEAEMEEEEQLSLDEL